MQLATFLYPRDSSFWQQPVVWAAIVIAMTVPFWATTLPPMMDLPGHMARFHIARDIDASADLQRFYSYKWVLAGNLGGDIFVYTLRNILSVQQATWLLCVVTLVLTTTAIPILSRTFHGSVQASAILALPLTWNYFSFWGLLNFQLSIALAFLAIAFWKRLERRIILRAILFALIAFMVWLTHTMGWALLCLCIGMIELQKTHERRKLLNIKTVIQNFMTGLPILLPVIPTLFWRINDGASATTYRTGFAAEKFDSLFTVLRSYNRPLDSFFTILILILLIVTLRHTRIPKSTPLLWCGIAIGTAFALMPTEVLGSYYADTRMVPVFIMLLVISIATPTHYPEKYIKIGLIFLLLLCMVRVGIIAYYWHQRDQKITTHLKALDFVPTGARILALQVNTCIDGGWAVDYEYNHLADMAIVRRNAFVNTQWQVHGALPARPIYNQDTKFGADPSQQVWDGNCMSKDTITLRQAFEYFPRTRFDYVWIMRSDLRSAPLPIDLKSLYADKYTALYQVVKSDAARIEKFNDQ